MEKLDAVAVVRQIRDSQYELTKNKSNEELKTYFRNEAELANVTARKLKRKRRSETKSSP